MVVLLCLLLRIELLRGTLRREDGAETESLGAKTREEVRASLVGVAAVILLVGGVHLNGAGKVRKSVEIVGVVVSDSTAPGLRVSVVIQALERDCLCYTSAC